MYVSYQKVNLFVNKHTRYNLFNIQTDFNTNFNLENYFEVKWYEINGVRYNMNNYYQLGNII